MKKFILILIIIVLIIVLGFGVKGLLDVYGDKDSEDSDEGWEIEAEYSYNGMIPANEIQNLDSNE